jgi:hypothetical protein
VACCGTGAAVRKVHRIGYLGLASAAAQATLADEDDPAVLDLDRIKAKAERLAAFCAQNPQMGMISAAEGVMGK